MSKKKLNSYTCTFKKGKSTCSYIALTVCFWHWIKQLNKLLLQLVDMMLEYIASQLTSNVSKQSVLKVDPCPFSLVTGLLNLSLPIQTVICGHILPWPVLLYSNNSSIISLNKLNYMMYWITCMSTEYPLFSIIMFSNK